MMRLVVAVLLVVGFLATLCRPTEDPRHSGAGRLRWQIPAHPVENQDGAWIVGTKALRHSRRARHVAYSSNGDYVASVDVEGELRIFSINSNDRSPAWIEAIEQSVNSLPAKLADARMLKLFKGGWPPKFKGGWPRIIAGTGIGEFLGACFANRDREILVWGSDGVWRVPFNPSYGSRAEDRPVPQQLFDGMVGGVVASADGSVLAAWSYFGHLKVWRPANPSWGMSGHLWLMETWTERSAALSSDGQLVAVVLGHQVLVSTSQGKHLVDFEVGKSPPVALRFSNTGQRLYLLTKDVRIHCFDLTRKEKAWSSPALTTDPRDVAKTFTCGPGQRLWVIGTGHGKILLWDAVTKRVRKEIQAANTAIFSLALSPSGKVLAFLSGNETVNLLELDTGADLAPPGHRAGVQVMGVVDGHTVQSIGRDGRVVSFDRASLTVRDTGVLQRPLEFGAALTPDGRVVAYGDRDGEISVVSLPGLQPRATLTWPERKIRAMSLSPQAEWVAAYSTRGEVKVWDVATRREVLTFSVSGLLFDWMGFRPSQPELVVVCEKDIFLTDLRTNKLTRCYHMADGVFLNCTLSPDGRSLAALVFRDIVVELHLIDLDAGRLTQSMKVSTQSDPTPIKPVFMDTTIAFLGSGERCVVLRRTPSVVEFATGKVTHPDPLPLPPRVEPLFGVVAGSDLIIACSDTTLLVYPLRLLR